MNDSLLDLPIGDRAVEKHKRTKLVALCSSVGCLARARGLRSLTGTMACQIIDATVTKENAIRGEVFCPDCKHALIWTRAENDSKAYKPIHQAEGTSLRPRRLGFVRQQLGEY